MRILLVTQEDAFHLPGLVSRVLAERRDDVVGVALLPGELARSNVGKYFQFMGGREFAHDVASHALARLKGRYGSGDRSSVASVAERHGVRVMRPGNVNDPKWRQELEALAVDLIVSLSAPQIFKPEILSLPQHGCINVHNSLLPRYQGLLPSFWVLANGEAETGTTVHYMTERIDDGEVILQERVTIEPTDTFHSLVHRTKAEVAPRVLLKAISLIESGEVEPLAIDWSQASYFSFPDRAAVQRFRAAGRRFR